MKINPWKLSTFALIGALAIAIASPATSAPQPNMKKALASLNAAKASLQKATDDKGGHRVNAIALVNQAIDQVKAGIAFDNKH